MKILIKVPATSANLGPGFDALGLALDLWNEAAFTPAENFRVEIEGEGAKRLPTNQNNAIVNAALQVYKMAGKSCKGLHVHCINRIPLTSGLGSSSAALLAGLLGANALLGEPFSREELLKVAVENEGHPDNVAPAMLGGLVVSASIDGKIITRKMNVAPLAAAIAMPNFHFPTKQARAALPKQIPIKDAVHNISRAVLVTKALECGDLELLGKVMDDALHQPYRLPLIPGAREAMDAAKEAGASAVALSGAGPSLIAFSAKEDAAIGEAMKREFESVGLTARIFELRVSDKGAEVESGE
jgi:homoserine kinase